MASSVSNLLRNSARFVVGVVALFRLRQDIADASDFLDDGLFARPLRLQRRQLFLQRGDVGIDFGDLLLVVDTEIAIADQRRLFGLAGGDRDTGILDHRRRRALADGNARRRRIQKTDGLVRQLPRRDIAVRQVDRGDDGGVGDTDLVVLFHRREDAAQHDAAGLDIGFVDVDRLEAPSQRRILLDVLPVFRPGRGGDGAQRSARQRGLEQVGGVTGSGRSTRADQRMRLVDEQDDRRRRSLHLVDHRSQSLLELALHRRAGLHQADIERA